MIVKSESFSLDDHFNNFTLIILTYASVLTMDLGPFCRTSSEMMNKKNHFKRSYLISFKIRPILHQANPIIKFGTSITGVKGKTNKNLELVACD